jgi:hypothetical protein
MILDGYNCYHVLTLDGERLPIVYRPMVRAERAELGRKLWFLNDEDFAADLYTEVIKRRVENFDDFLPRVFIRVRDQLLNAVLGLDPVFTEDADAKNLADGVRFSLEHPKLARHSCAYCQEWWFDPLTGETTMRRGQPIKRPLYAKKLCESPRGCPKGTPEDSKDLSPKNVQALNHYMECRAVGKFPDDAIVRKNARIIANELSRAKQFQFGV